MVPLLIGVGEEWIRLQVASLAASVTVRANDLLRLPGRLYAALE